MKRNDWLQRGLYLIMVILGVYIARKLGIILQKSSMIQKNMENGKIQQTLEDAAMQTVVPGYTGVVDGQAQSGILTDWIKPALPVYSYLAQLPPEETETETQETEKNRKNAPSAHQDESEQEDTEVVKTNASLLDYQYLLNHYFTVDSGTTADKELLDGEALLKEDLRIEKDSSVPQILIYHTHSQEAFADSRDGEIADTIVGMGEVLAELLETQYGYQVIHDTGVYDLVDGVLDRSTAYDYARESVEQILKDNPTIQVIIDLHRDGVDGKKFVTEIDGRPTSMIMFFNGISRNSDDQPLDWLENPYIRQNLAFSLQLELKARDQYPDYTRNIYLKAERFNLHLRPRSLLIEAGTQLNTVEEERNAMIPLAELLDQVLCGRS